jgi:hypothetical protein
MYLTDASRFLISCVIQHYAPVVGWGGGGGKEQMHNVDYDPGPWRQTLKDCLRRGSNPGRMRHRGALYLNSYLIPVLRIPDVYPGSQILIFTHRGSQIPDPKTAIKERGEKKLLS